MAQNPKVVRSFLSLLRAQDRGPERAALVNLLEQRAQQMVASYSTPLPYVSLNEQMRAMSQIFQAQILNRYAAQRPSLNFAAPPPNVAYTQYAPLYITPNPPSPQPMVITNSFPIGFLTTMTPDRAYTEINTIVAQLVNESVADRQTIARILQRIAYENNLPLVLASDPPPVPADENLCKRLVCEEDDALIRSAR